MSDVNGRNGTHDDRNGRSFELDITSMVQIPVKNGPISDIGINHDGSRLVVANYGRDTVSIIDTDARRVVQTVAGLNEPFAIAVSGGDAARAYVSTATTAYDSIDVVDLATNARIATHPLAHSVSDLTVSADGRFVYASRNWRPRRRCHGRGHHHGRLRGDRNRHHTGDHRGLRAHQSRRTSPVRRHQRAVRRRTDRHRNPSAVRRPHRRHLRARFTHSRRRAERRRRHRLRGQLRPRRGRGARRHRHPNPQDHQHAKGRRGRRSAHPR